MSSPELLGMAPAEQPEVVATAERHMTDVEAATVLGSVGLETRAAILILFNDPDLELSGLEISQVMANYQSDEPLWEHSNAYYGTICSRLSREDIGFLRKIPGARRGWPPHRFGRSETGYHLGRPVAGHLWRWGIDYNLPLRNVLGENRMDDKDTAPVILLRMGVLSVAAGNKSFTYQKLEKAMEKHAHPETLRRHARKLIKNGILVKQASDRLALAKDKREAITALLTIFAGMVTFDEDFYARGQALADAALENPQTIRYLIKRVEVTSEHTSGRRVDYPAIADQIHGITSGGRMISSAEILERFGAGFDAQRRYSLLQKLRKDPRLHHVGGNGDYIFSSATDDL